MTRSCAVAVLTAAVTMACGRDETPTPEKKQAVMPASTAVPATAPPAGAATVPPAALTTSAGDFGVRECDEYVRKYLACVESKVPEAARPMVRQSLEQSRESWRRAAATPEGKATLASTCTQMDVTSRTAMQAYGCSW